MGILNINKESKSVRLVTTILIGSVGGLIFAYINMPLPWLLGPMIALLIGARFSKIQLFWPTRVRGWGLIVVGYSSGSSISRNTLSQIARDLPWMLVMTIALILFGAITAILVSKLAKVDYASALIGGVPGGLTQMTVLAEEMEEVDCTVVAFQQIVRSILTVLTVPLLIYSPLYSVEKTTNATAAALATVLPTDVLVWKVILFTIISVLSAVVANKIKMPTAYLLGPILGVGIVSVLGFHGPAVSRVLLDIAQFSIGSYLGLLLKPEKLQNKARIISLSILNSVVLILFSLVLSYIMIKAHNIDAVTSFLCMAPGAADNMSLMARVISADVSMVTGYQMFRVLFINFIVPPILKWFCRKCLGSNKTDCNLNFNDNDQS